MKVIIGRFFYQKKGRERGECTSLCKWEAERDGLGMETDMVGEKESMREDIGIRQIKKIDLTQNYEREVSWWFKKTEREKEKQKGDEKIPRYTPEKERRGNREREHQQLIVNRRRINCSEKLCLTELQNFSPSESNIAANWHGSHFLCRIQLEFSRTLEFRYS